MVDGKWRTVGFKALFRAAVGMSKLYNGILAERARCRPGRTAPHVHRRHRRRELRHTGPARKKRPRRGATWRVVAQGAARPHMMPVPPQRNGPRFQLEASAGSVSDPGASDISEADLARDVIAAERKRLFAQVARRPAEDEKAADLAQWAARGLRRQLRVLKSGVGARARNRRLLYPNVGLTGGCVGRL